MPAQRLALLLDVIADIEIDGFPLSEAAERLPNVFAESRAKPEPEEVAATSPKKQGRYTPKTIGLGRVPVYLQQYTLVPIRPSVRDGSIEISGDSDKVNRLIELAESIDVENYQQCVEATSR